MKKLFAKKKTKVGGMTDILNQEHEGAVAFEYIIILVIMAVVIFAAWKILGDELKLKAQEIANFIAGNGQGELNSR